MMRRLRKARGKLGGCARLFVCVRRKCEASVASIFPRFRERELVRSSDETNMESERKYSERTGSGVHNNTRNVVCFFDLNYYFAAM